MIIIREEQLKVLEQETEKNLKHRLAKQLRSDFPKQTDTLSDSELQQQVEEGYIAAKKLAVEQPDDIYRFLKLTYISKDILSSVVVRNAFYCIITNTNIEASKRLDFVEHNIVNR